MSVNGQTYTFRGSAVVPPAPVTSVFGRVGAVVAAVGDYVASQVNNDSGVAGATVKAALDALQAAIPAVPVASVFGRVGAVVAAAGDYVASQVGNDSAVPGVSVANALNNLAGAIPAVPVASVFGRIGAVVSAVGDYVASQVNNDSGVAGATVKAALDNLQAAIPSVPVASVFGRIGAVVSAAGDYVASQVNNDSGVAGATVKAALDNLLAAIPAVPVASVFGRTGAVVAVAGDYVASKVTNDSTVAGATVKAALDTLQTSVGFSVLGSINPRHYWSAANVLQSGGPLLVDAMVDMGRVPRNFTQVGAARCPLGTDAFGNPYMAPDGIADFYQAGVAADWGFLISGNPFTIGIVIEITAAPAALGTLLATSNLAGAANRYSIVWTRVSATQFGPTSTVFQGTVGPVSQSEYLSPTTNRFTLVIEHHGNLQLTAANVLGLSQVMRFGGFPASYQGAITNAYPGGAPPATLTLFAGSTPNAFGQNMRLYEMWIEDGNVPDGVILQYEQYTRNVLHSHA